MPAESMGANTIHLSIVVPTRNRLDRLRVLLDSLSGQAGSTGDFEVLVADDGSTDGTAEFLAAPPRLRYRLRAVRLEGAGAAAARNRAIREASASRVLLLGDDTFPAPDAVRRHVEGDRDNRTGLQGRIVWDPESAVTPVMRFLAPEGPQFFFRDLRDGQPVPYTVQYGANLSAPKAWFLEEPFDEHFPEAAFEDTELAYRWRRRGYIVLYREDLVCSHRHHYSSIEDFLSRPFAAGRAARYAAGRNPGMALRTILQPLAVGLHHGARHALRTLLGSASEEDSWDLRCRAAFFRGLFSRPGRRRPAGGAAP